MLRQLAPLARTDDEYDVKYSNKVISRNKYYDNIKA